MEKMSWGEIIFNLAIPATIIGLIFTLGFMVVRIGALLLKNIA